MTLNLIIMALLSLTVTTLVHPCLLRYAWRHKIFDNPDARKLHRKPVPVLGGLAVYSGILAGSVAMWLFVERASLNWTLLAITSMLIMGIWDDLKNLPALLRLLVQFAIVGAYIAFSGHYIADLFGLFGIHQINPWLGIPLSLVAGVGVINAINMIDGVDGYSSGFGILACAAFAVVFLLIGQKVWAPLALITASALIPFFLHNVFGAKTKMFIGDGGTMMLGALMAVFLLGTLSPRFGLKLVAHGICPPALTLAILSIPVFDTLRVMTARIFRGRSPFKPDKSHLHHLFIDMGFSHLGAALCILLINIFVFLLWYILWSLGASQNTQALAVLITSFTVTFGFYKFMRWHQHSGPLNTQGIPQGTALWHAACRLGSKSNRKDTKIWLAIQSLVDSSWPIR